MTKGTKDDVWIYRMVAQSKGNCLPATDIIKRSSSSSIYATLVRLCGWKDDDIAGPRLFCFQDLTDCTKDFNNECEKLKAKLKKYYGSLFALQWNWKKVKIVPEERTPAKTILKVSQENIGNDEIFIKLYTNEDNDKEKVEMIIRGKFVPTYDINKHLREIKWFAKIYSMKSVLTRRSYLRKWIKSNYISLPIPLIPERRGGRLYFRILSRLSYYSDVYTRAHLYSRLNIKSEKMIESCVEKIHKLTFNSNDLPNKQKLRVMKLKSEISKIENGIRYRNLSMTVKGLLAYVLLESNYEEFKKSIRNLAECEEYEEIKREVYDYDKTSGFPQELQKMIPLTYNNTHYKITINFPFLSYYDILEKSLPEKFVFNLLITIAKKVKKKMGNSLTIIEPVGLKYLITREFYNKINAWIWKSGNTSDNSANTSTPPTKHSSTEMGLTNYLSEIGQYIQHEKVKKSVERENFRKYVILQRRYDKLYAAIYAAIERNKENREIVPIYKQIKKAGIPWSHISDILRSIKDKYGNKFVVTDTCLIPKSITGELRALLRGSPTVDNGRASLIKYGVPEDCITPDFLSTLGFCTGFEDSDTGYKSPRILKLKNEIYKRKAKLSNTAHN